MFCRLPSPVRSSLRGALVRLESDLRPTPFPSIPLLRSLVSPRSLLLLSLGFVDAVKIEDFTLGKNAFRILNMRALPDQPGDKEYPREEWIDQGDREAALDPNRRMKNEEDKKDKGDVVLQEQGNTAEEEVRVPISPCVGASASSSSDAGFFHSSRFTARHAEADCYPFACAGPGRRLRQLRSQLRLVSFSVSRTPSLPLSLALSLP